MPNFSGMWTLQSQMQAIAAGTWTGLPEFELYAWGRGSAGRLGLNDVANRSSPVQVGALTDWDQVASSEHSAAIKTNGQLWTWGKNNSGQLGQNNTTYRSSPVQVGALTDWAQVSGGVNNCVAIKTNGTLWSWGYNNVGQLGQNNTTNLSSPIQVGALTDWVQVSASNFCAAVKTNGTLWSWGFNSSGQLGQNNTINLSSPVQVGALTDWAQVSASGDDFCAAVKTNGTLWSWGSGTFGKLGHNNTISLSSPVQVGALTDWAQVSAGNVFCAAIKTNGTLWTWGISNDGRLGLNFEYGNNRSSPTQVGALTDWAQVSAGNAQCVAIKTNGTLWSWGQNNYFTQLGLNDTVSRSSPVQVGALTTWFKIGQGSQAQNVLAITS